VLGASGFLGRWIARVLAEEGAELIVTARDLGALAAVQRQYGFTAEARALDVLEPLALRSLIEAVNPDVLFNAIGYGVDRTERDESLAHRINSELPVTIATYLAPPQTLIHVGSALEYGTIDGDLRETSVPNPTTLYGRTKLEGTLRLCAHASQADLRAFTARLFTLYGPGEHEGRLLPTLFAARGSAKPLDFTAGDQRRDFTYVEEVARTLVELARSDRPKPGDIVNVATGRLVSVREFIETAMRVLGIPPERIRFGALSARAEEMSHDDVSVSHLVELLGHALAVTPEEGIRRAMVVPPPAS
jgi:UDP-glucose 4-epimerase